MEPIFGNAPVSFFFCLLSFPASECFVIVLLQSRLCPLSRYRNRFYSLGVYDRLNVLVVLDSPEAISRVFECENTAPHAVR